MPQEHPDGPLVTVFSSRRHDAETEAEVIYGLLESAGINAIIVRENVQELPAGKIWVKVVESAKEDADQVIRDAQSIADREIEEADSDAGAGTTE